MLNDEGRKELKEIGDYWGNRSIHHMAKKYLTKELAEQFWIFNWESATPNYDKILTMGLKGILDEARERLKKLDEEYMAETINGMDFVKRRTSCRLPLSHWRPSAGGLRGTLLWLAAWPNPRKKCCARWSLRTSPISATACRRVPPAHCMRPFNLTGSSTWW
jgi:hypothetical protein